MHSNRGIALATLSVAALVVAGLGPSAAYAVPAPPGIAGALDVSGITAAEYVGDPGAVAARTGGLVGFPTSGQDFVVLSTGRATDLDGQASTFVSTDLLGAAQGADGNDMTQLRLELQPPATAMCVAVDFAFLSEEYPEYVGTRFNDIFTAELNESLFSVDGDQVVAPNNFAFDPSGNLISINTVFGMAPGQGTTMDGITPPLSAVSPIERRADGRIELILTVQDLGDSIFDSAVVLDNMRWLYGENCERGTSNLTDTDGDALPDEWETQGIDYDGDGVPELDLPAMGADPRHADVFVEVDWMVRAPTCTWEVCWGGESFAPQRAALDDVVAAFAAAPVINPDGTSGIRLHVDSGPGSVMNAATGATWGARSAAGAVPHKESLGSFSGKAYDWTEFETVKLAHLSVFRRDAFHYVLYADTYAGTSSSGLYRGIPSSDSLVTDGHPAWRGGFSRTQERGSLMHELGHNLNLRHGGGDDVNSKPDYLSIMNYLFQLEGLPPDSRPDYSDGPPFDDWANLRFDGGSIGDLGESAPLPQLTDVDEIDPAIAEDLDAFARDGDGIATLLGPTVLLTGSGERHLFVDVTNHGAVTDTFTVTLGSFVPGLGGTRTVQVPAGGTGRVAVPVDTGGLAVGTHPVSATLSSTLGGAGLFVAELPVTVADRSAPGVEQQIAAALVDIAGLPPDSGLDPQVRDEVVDMLTGDPSAEIPADCAVPPSIDLAQFTVVIGTDGDDVLHGTEGPDYICGRLGTDEIHGHGGDDLVVGDTAASFTGAGAAGAADSIEAGDGDDRVLAGPGADAVTGGAGADVLTLEDGDDSGNGGAGGDTVAGGPGRDRIHGAQGADTLVGGFHDDVVNGGPGDDTLAGELAPGSPAPGPGQPPARRDVCVGAGGHDSAVDCDVLASVEHTGP